MKRNNPSDLEHQITAWLKSVLNVSLALNLDSINTLWTIRQWSSLLSLNEPLLSDSNADQKNLLSPQKACWLLK